MLAFAYLGNGERVGALAAGCGGAYIPGAEPSWGPHVRSGRVSGVGNFTVDMHDAAPGTYVLRVFQGVRTYQGRFVMEAR